MSYKNSNSVVITEEKGNDTNTIAPEPVKKGENIIDYSYPKDISKIVFVRRKNKFKLPVVKKGNSLEDETVEKIGGELKNGVTLRGLTPEEEKRFLPELIGVQPSDNEWIESAKAYWDNITKNVPISNEDGTGGLKLEVGFHYNTKADFEDDEKAIRDKNGVIINPKGTPINIVDYILWRYCLVYSHVANNFNDVGKSPKIRFYIYSQEEEEKEKYVSFEQKKKAQKLFDANLHDTEWVDNVLRVLLINAKGKRISVQELSSMNSQAKVLLLDDFVSETPLGFLAVASDKLLGVKSFIEIAVLSGVFNRIPNTLTISYEGDVIGNTTDEVAIFLTNPKNKEIYDRVKAQVAVRPS